MARATVALLLTAALYLGITLLSSTSGVVFGTKPYGP